MSVLLSEESQLLSLCKLQMLQTCFSTIIYHTLVDLFKSYCTYKHIIGTTKSITSNPCNTDRMLQWLYSLQIPIQLHSYYFILYWIHPITNELSIISTISPSPFACWYAILALCFKVSIHGRFCPGEVRELKRCCVSIKTWPGHMVTTETPHHIFIVY